jgi:hypothetical protein
MQRLRILHEKLRFISWFFGLTTTPFAGIKCKIKAGDHPYKSSAMPDDSSEPPFVMEWLDADQAIRLQGQLCLSLLQRSLLEYLDETVKVSSRQAPNKKKNWFENYKRWFLDLGVDWTASGADLSLLEEMTVARNRIKHGSRGDSQSVIKRQDQDYLRRFPQALFESDLEARIFRNSGPKLRSIELTDEKLQKATDEIKRFASFIEEHLPVAMKYWHS